MAPPTQDRRRTRHFLCMPALDVCPTDEVTNLAAAMVFAGLAGAVLVFAGIVKVCLACECNW